MLDQVGTSHSGQQATLPSPRRRGVSVSAAISFGLRRHAEGCSHYRGCRLRLLDARAPLFLTARFGEGCVLRGRPLRLGAGCRSRTGSGCVSTGWGCVLRTASANIWCNSALVGAEGFVILPLF